MRRNLNATFEVTDWDERPFDQQVGVSKLTSATVEKTYSGEIEGSSVTMWLMAYDPDETAEFVGIERVRGMIGGRRGSIVIRHVGVFTDGVAKAELTIVSGTDELTDASGTGEMVADPAGSVTLSLDI